MPRIAPFHRSAEVFVPRNHSLFPHLQPPTSYPQCPWLTLTGQRGTVGSSWAPEAPAPKSRGGSNNTNQRLFANPDRVGTGSSKPLVMCTELGNWCHLLSFPTYVYTPCLMFVFCRALSKLIFGIPPGQLETSAKPLGWSRL